MFRSVHSGGQEGQGGALRQGQLRAGGGPRGNQGSLWPNPSTASGLRISGVLPEPPTTAVSLGCASGLEGAGGRPSAGVGEQTRWGRRESER